MLAVRSATPADAGPLARIAEETFRATFAAMNAAEDMDLHCQSRYGADIQAAEIENPGMLTLLCEEGGALAGFAQLKWGAAPACVATAAPGEVHRLYVRAHWHGKGAAQELMRSGIEALTRRGCDAVWLGVWERNPRAIAFYRKWGFVEVGHHVFPLGRDPQRDVVMMKTLAGTGIVA